MDSITIRHGSIAITDEEAEEIIIKYLIRNRTRRQIDLLLSICDESDGETEKNPSENPISEPVTDIYGDDMIGTPRQEIKLSATKKAIKRPRRTVEQYTMDGELVGKYPSIRAATRQGYDYHGIRNCCNGKSQQEGNYRWRFAQQGQSI